MSKISSNKIIFSSNINIGQNGAENDNQFLFNCFVDHEAIAELRNMESSAMFALGSTGSGKTAILRMIEKLEVNVSNLELADMAMEKIGSSDTVGFLKSLDLDLSLIFQFLWKHVICIEYIKLISAADNADKFRVFKSKFLEFFYANKAKDKLEEFLKEYEGQFWNTLDENVIEFTDALEKGVNAEFGAEVEKFQARAGYSRTLSSERKIQLQQRAKKFVNPEALSKQSQIISALSEYTRGRQDKFYILIDKIDEHWIDDSLKFQMISSLFEALKGFQKLRNFKVIVALRNDIYERMKAERSPSRSQLEKYEDYIVRLRWSKSQLKTLADRRINHLFKWQYSKANVLFSDVFDDKVAGGNDPWRHLVERTLNRPRDVINFVNLSLRAAEGKSSVSRNDFKTAEQNYSDLRFEALLHEWSGTYPTISLALSVLRSRSSYFEVSSVSNDNLEDWLLLRVSDCEGYERDEMWSLIDRSSGGEKKGRTNRVC